MTSLHQINGGFLELGWKRRVLNLHTIFSVLFRERLNLLTRTGVTENLLGMQIAVTLMATTMSTVCNQRLFFPKL